MYNNKEELLNALVEADPGWDEWSELIALVETLDMKLVEEEYLGQYIAEGSRLCFGPIDEYEWPDWIPSYVPAIRGMKADEPMMAGGYADVFDETCTVRGSVFVPGGVDTQIGFPEFDVPEGIYNFQCNSSGALFHVDKSLNVLAPNSKKKRLEVIDSLEVFTRKNIRQTLIGESWFKLYDNLPSIFLD